ncbi:MAG: C25 family cysteine peptidase, partial [Acidobacteriota bacterium]|nr:C25 family cysteine peptidase [Acidobacteriota bacterium]
LDSRVVPLEQIYDEWNDGIASPWAIERFLAYAAVSWTRRPSAIVLAGIGTYDYKDYLGLGGNLIPPLMVRTGDGLFAADSRFVPAAGGGGMVIGRLPARSAQELSGMIDKLIAYESSPAGTWKRQALFLADGPDTGGQFDWQSERAAALVPQPLNPTRLYVSAATPAEQVRRTLLGDLESGAFLLNYIGHAGLDRLSAASIFTNQDAAALGNAPRLPVVVTASCIVGRFEIPGFTSLAVALMLNPAGGAAAVWAPSGLAWSTQSTALGNGLLGQLFASQTSTMGGAVEGGVQRFRTAGGASDTLLTYNLFGDPALLLQKPN